VQEIFIFREYLVSHWGLVRIDNECVFDSLEKAIACLKNEARNEVQPQFRFSIIKLPLNDTDPWHSVEEWEYLTNGELLKHIYPGSEPEEANYEGRFSVGDIVRIKSEIECPSGGLVFENAGVVYQLPEEADHCYVVVFITEKGFVSHLHLPEAALSREGVVVTEENQFLNVISEHLKNGSIEEINNVWCGDVYVKNIHPRYYG
jgi:hypothetical protein